MTKKINNFLRADVTFAIIVLCIAASCVPPGIAHDEPGSLYLDTIPPDWRNQGQSNIMIQPDESISLYAQGKDNVALNWAWLSTNETGQWMNITSWWNYNWKYGKQIIIDHSKVVADFIDFPVLIAFTSSDFIAHAQPDGDDFVFVDATNTLKYEHEIEYYSSTTGDLVAWVKIPFLSSTVNTIFYLYFGNPTCGNQANVEATWNSNYIMVHHMTGASFSQLKDSTANHWDITSAGGSPVYNIGGEVGKCVDFNGAGSYLKASGFRLLQDSSHTGSCWVYVDGNPGTRRYAFEGDSDYDISLLVWNNESFKNYAHSSGGTPVCYSTTKINVTNPQWYYICTRADATSDRLNIFVNGVNEAHTTISGTINPETQGLNIGTYRDNNNNWMNGKIDEIRISNCVRNDAWIKTEYNNMVSPSTFTTLKDMSPLKMTENDQWQWSNFTWKNPSIPPGTHVGWRIYYNDTSGNLNCTNIMNFLIEEPKPPYEPSNPNPAQSANMVNIDSDLSWTGGDPNPGDTVTYDVYFGTTSSPPQVAWNQSFATYDPGIMNYDTIYYWKIVAWDNHKLSTLGPLWSFITDYRPNTPSNPNPADGATGIDISAILSWAGGDPDPGDIVTYDVYFGTTSPPPLLVHNQTTTTYDPGTMNFNTKYYWKIVSWDQQHASKSGPQWRFTTTPAFPKLEIESINGGKGITVIIKNNGTANATNVKWKIEIANGLFVIPREANGTIPTIAPGLMESTDLMKVFGIGLGIITPLPTITVHVTCVEGSSTNTTRTAKILGPFVI